MKALLPEAASVLASIDAARIESEDAARSATLRIQNFGSGADPLVIERLNATRQRAAADQGQHAQLANKIREWLSKLPPDSILELAPPPPDAQRDGETIAESIERLRDEIIAAQSHRIAVQRAPLPRSDAKKLVADYVRQLSQRGKPQVSIVRDHLNVSFVDMRHADFFTHVDAAAMLAWLDPVAMTKRLEAEIDAMPEERRDAMSVAERKQRVAELNASIETLERAEEGLIQKAAAQGITIIPRSDADPKCVLGVVVRQEEAQAA